MTRTFIRPSQSRACAPQPRVSDCSAPVRMRRRAEAAHRLEGGDPWPREHDALELSADAVSAWAYAANHLLADGLTPIVPVEVLRELHRRGGQDRAVAVEVYESGGTSAA